MWKNLVSKQIFTSNIADELNLLGLFLPSNLNENGNKGEEKKTFHSSDDTDMMNSFELSFWHVIFLQK